MTGSRKSSCRRLLALCLTVGPLVASSASRGPDLRCAPAAAARDAGADQPLARLERLYKDRRYFELRDAVNSMKEAPNPEMEFYRGAVDDAFNRLDSSINRLRRYLEAGGTAGGDPPLAREAWVILGSAYMRSGQYRKAAEAQRRILERFGTALEKEERTNRQSQVILWSALADAPPQSLERLGESVIPLENRHFPVRIKDKTFYFMYDTGASLSVLYQSAAQELGLTLLAQGAKVCTATGNWLETWLAVVPELRFGRTVIRNAAFLVMPDSYFPVRKVREGVERRGLIGIPILAALKEIAETRDGRLIIPASPRPRPVENLCFYGTKPLTEAFFRGARLVFELDTGSSLTYLYPTFYHRNKEEIQSRSTPRPVRMGTLGGERTVTVYVLDVFPCRVGGRDLALRKVMVHTEFTHSNTEIFDGTVGIDVLSHASRMTINFDSMSFVLE
jgi:tetratricopeptide (TPR) repeat protein